MTVLHPRPRLTRDRWTDLCGEWDFGYDDDDRGLAEEWHRVDCPEPFDRRITVPYPPESKLSGIGDPAPHPVVWYRREFDVPAADRDGRVLLHFGAVDYAAQVWVNGQLVASHTGGHTPFHADITGVLRPDSEPQVVVVRAEDPVTDPSQPRGKQDWRDEPKGVWYDRTTGIWQPVWLEPVPPVHVTELHFIPDVTAAQVRLEAKLNRAPDTAADLRVRLRLGDEILAEETVRLTTSEVCHEISVPAARHGIDLQRLLWSPEKPTLIDADVTVTDGDTTDEIGSYLGFRSVGAADRRFLLNGKPYYLRLVLEQGFWPESHLAAPDPDALRTEVELVKQLGFNGVRVHQKVEDPRFLYWCDRLGLLVWGEMASAYGYSPDTVDRFTREWLEVLRRDRGHPSIVTWVPLNESWGVPGIAEDPAQQHFATGLYHLTKAIDPSRPVISNDGWEHTESDIWGVHDYGPTGTGIRERYGTEAALHRTLHSTGPGRHRVLLGDPADRGQPVMVTEFGGLSYTPSEGENWAGYATVETDDELFALFSELVDALLDCPDVAGFCYTQLTDTMQERNGLLTGDRTPKIDPERVREVLTRPAAAIPAEAVDRHRAAAHAAQRGQRRPAAPNPGG